MFGAWKRRPDVAPHQHTVTVCIPHLETIRILKASLACLRRQTLSPYYLIIDTGSNSDVAAELEQFRADDCEIHYLRPHACRHSSWPISVALDMAQALCQTERLYMTHADVFHKDPEWLASLATLCTARRPVVGYEMSPRSWATDAWQGMVGHTSTMIYMPTVRNIGAMWNVDEAMARIGGYGQAKAAWPDTETAFGLILRSVGIRPLLVGHETNDPYYEDDTLIHVRSYTSRRHNPDWQGPERDAYYRRADEVIQAAIDGSLCIPHQKGR